MGDLRDEYLAHARALRREGVGYQVHGWDDQRRAVEKWIKTCPNVLQKLGQPPDAACTDADRFRLPVNVPAAIKQLSRPPRNRDALTWVWQTIEDAVDDTDYVKAAIDKFVDALQEAIDRSPGGGDIGRVRGGDY